MKLIKLIALFFFFAPMAMAMNFYGVQSLNGIGTTPIFTAPASGIYFLQGNLTLPWYNGLGTAGSSQVIATVSKNYTTQLYVGLPGASGFALPQMTLVSNDLITVGLSSPITFDSATGAGLNVITGQVYYGNAF